MDADRYARVRAVFLQALTTPPEGIAALLDTTCGDDHELREQVSSLLAQHHATGSFLDTPMLAGPERAPLPERIGPFRVLELLGEGGMGVVYRAEQEHPRRAVALKLIRPGFATPRALRRFELEADLLGRLQHPGIAQIFAAGQADTGAGLQPYFAMELVRGVPLDVWADRQQLDVRQRLALLAEVCDAAHHAHQRGIVHCDLKPSNILVDTAGRARVLDFGVARLADDSLPQQTLLSGAGQMVGTLAYMSPEQTLADPGQIDTRTDVYSLGVIGYQLLSGRLPLPEAGADLLAAVAAVRETEPVPLHQHDRALRGDVTTIIHTAMHKDRERRYASASDLAADLRRWLQHQPIAARPASRGYVLRRFARRHRALAGALLATIAALVAGVIGTTAGMWQARAAERAATEQRRLADRTAEFLERTIFTIDPLKVGGEIQMADVLRKAAAEVGSTFADEPLAEARVRATLGQTMMSLGLLAEAEHELALARDLRAARLGAAAAETLAVTSHLALVRKELGRLAEAEALFREVAEVSAAQHGADDNRTLNANHNLAEVLQDQGRDQAARALYLAVLERRLATLGPDHRYTLATENNLAALDLAANDPAAAVPRFRHLAEVRLRQQGPDHPEYLATRNNLAHALQQSGNLAEAERHYREALAGQVRVIGPDHADTLTTQDNLAEVLQQLGRTDDAEAQLRQSLAARRRALGPDHVDSLRTGMALASLLLQVGRTDEGAVLVEEHRARRAAATADDGIAWLAVDYRLAFALQSLGRLAEAEAAWQELIRRELAAGRATRPETCRARHNLASVQHGLGRTEQAIATLTEALPDLRRVFAAEQTDRHESLYALAFLHLLSQQPQPAIPLLQECLAGQQQGVGPGDPKTLITLATLARAQQLAGDQGAEASFASLEQRVATAELAPERMSLHALNRIGILLLQARRHAAAQPVFDRLAELAAAAPQAAGAQAPTFARNRADCLLANGRHAEAEQVLTDLLAAAERPGDPAAGERPRILRSLLALYDQSGQTEQAAALRARLANETGTGR